MSSLINYFSDKRTNVPKSNYKLSHKNSFDANFGEAIPFLFLDTIPGDEFKFNPQALIKSAPLVAPITNDVNINLRLFYVPIRQVWGVFQDVYMNRQSDEVPAWTFTTANDFKTWYQYYARIYTHFGLPEDYNTMTGGTEPAWWPARISKLPLRAYNRIYYHYYMDHNKYNAAELTEIQTAMLNATSQVNSWTNCILNENKYLIDYTLGASSGYTANWNRGYYEVMNTGDWQSKIFDTVNVINVQQGSTINELKSGYSLQRFYDNLIDLKRNFKDYSNRMFGISRDTLSDRPLYLGGATNQLLISDVTAMSEATNQPLGSYAGKGFGKVDTYQKFDVPEFGYIIGIMDITPKVSYSKALHPRLIQQDYLDFYHPEFANTYIDTVYYKNVNADYTAPLLPDSIFGYQRPFNEYRYTHDKVSGRLANDLNYWTIQHNIAGNVRDLAIGRLHKYTGDYSDSFNPNYPKENLWKRITSNIFAVNTEPQFYIEALNGVDAQRVIPHVEQDFIN